MAHDAATCIIPRTIPRTTRAASYVDGGHAIIAYEYYSYALKPVSY